MSTVQYASTPISNGRAIIIGTLWVNIPVMILIFGGWFGLGPAALALGAFENSQPIVVPIVTGVLVVVVPFAAGWLWWSFNVPKWRIWALERTSDWLTLQQAAIAAGLIWDERTAMGKIFARTEIWSARDRRREADLRLKHPPMPN